MFNPAQKLFQIYATWNIIRIITGLKPNSEIGNLSLDILKLKKRIKGSIKNKTVYIDNPIQSPAYVR